MAKRIIWMNPTIKLLDIMHENIWAYFLSVISKYLQSLDKNRKNIFIDPVSGEFFYFFVLSLNATKVTYFCWSRYNSFINISY